MERLSEQGNRPQYMWEDGFDIALWKNQPTTAAQIELTHTKKKCKSSYFVTFLPNCIKKNSSLNNSH